nr:MAG TPA: hypothetical protein [Caudoviricetes sp.]
MARNRKSQERRAKEVTVLEAFRKRGLWVPERNKPVYMVEYGERPYLKQVMIEVSAPQNAKEELVEKWREFANNKRMREDNITAIYCIGNDGFEGLDKLDKGKEIVNAELRF